MNALVLVTPVLMTTHQATPNRSFLLLEFVLHGVRNKVGNVLKNFERLRWFVLLVSDQVFGKVISIKGI